MPVNRDQVRILLQTTIVSTADDWHIGRFALLHEHLRSLKDGRGATMYDVVSRDREFPPFRRLQLGHLARLSDVRNRSGRRAVEA